MSGEGTVRWAHPSMTGYLRGGEGGGTVRWAHPSMTGYLRGGEGGGDGAVGTP